MTQTFDIEDYLSIRQATNPTFSPTGKSLAYLSNESGSFQIYVMPTQGGAARQLTHFEDSVEFAAYSPSEEKIMFGKGSHGDEKTQLYLLDVPTGTFSAVTKQADAKHRWGRWSRDGKRFAYASTERNGKDFDVYVYSMVETKARLVFDRGGWAGSAGFSPDGSKLVVYQMRTFVDSDLYLIELESGDIHLVTPHQGEAEYGMASWLPDSSGFFYVSNETRDKKALWKYDLKTDKRGVVLKSESEIEQASLSYDGMLLAVTLNDEGYHVLKLYDAKTMQEISSPRSPDPSVFGTAWSLDSQQLAVGKISATENLNIFLWDKNSRSNKQVTKVPMPVPSTAMIEPRLIHYKSFDDLDIPAFVYTPANPHGGAIVSMHGGPEGQEIPTLHPLAQYFMSRGYVVVAPNVRGSTGYGRRYSDLDNVGKRLDSVEDMRYLHKYLSESDIADPRRIGLIGASYGGYMVLAGLAFQPELWAAGVDIVGIANLVSFLENTSPWRRKQREAEYGSLSRDRAVLESVSPLNKVDQIKAPLMVIHGANDPRVPVSEAEQIVARLKQLKQPVEYLLYPDEGHGLAKLKNKIDAFPKVAAFFDQHLRADN